MQMLYSYYQDETPDMAAKEKDLFKTIQKTYDLYLYLLYLLPEVAHTARLIIESNKSKRLATKEDLFPNLKFVNNPVLNRIENNTEFKLLIEKKKINWQNEHDLPLKIYRSIKDGQTYKDYMAENTNDFSRDSKFLKKIFEEFIALDEMVHFLMEEHNIHWYGDIEMAIIAVIRTIESIKEKDSEDSKILSPLYKDEEDDILFVKDLFRKTIANSERFEKLIQLKSANWELDRVAVIDVLLMKMALTEFIYLKSIPVKVTLNEYIDISKDYSTPKSKLYINGVLDNLLIDLKKTGEIAKVGRGLVG